MPDSTGSGSRDACIPKDSKEEEKKEAHKQLIIDTITSMMKRARLNKDNANEMGFVVPATDDDPERFVRLADMERALENMALVHEIAVNDQFKLKPTVPDDTAAFVVQKTMRDAYWDLVASELAKDPPDFDPVIKLLRDVKETFRSLLLGNNDRALATILATLDESKMRELANEHGRSLLEANAQLILKFMGLACCPVRDAAIEALKRETDTLKQLRGIMETLDLMKMDMANFILMAARKQFVRYSVECERKHFEELRKVYGDRFVLTEEWLKRNDPALKIAGAMDGEEVGGSGAGGGAASAVPTMVNLNGVQMPDYFIEAYQELLLPEQPQHGFPELLSLDQGRMQQMRADAMRLVTCATVMQLTCAAIPTLVYHPMRADLAAKLAILSVDYPGKTERTELLESLYVQVLDCVNAHAAEPDGPLVESFVKQALRTQIANIECKMAVYGIIWRKLMEYLRDIVMAVQESYQPLPVCFRDYGAELAKLACLFKRVVCHNFEVYGKYYLKTIKKPPTP